MKKIIGISCVLVILLISACGNSENIQDNASKENIKNENTTPSENWEPLHLDDLNPQLITANQQFGLELYRTLVSEASGENVFISPLSISMALAMAYNGADGETKENMEQALQLHGMTFEEINEGYATLKTIIEAADPNVALTIANSLWSREGLAFDEEFIQRVKQYYHAEATALDFNDIGAAETINQWVDEKTESKITEIVEGPISEDTILFLINAIYFKGDWSRPFDEQLTEEQDFYLSDGTTISHPLMAQSGSYYYFENEQLQAIRLPYGEEENLSMLLFLPTKTSDLNELHQLLSAENWNKWLASFTRKQGSLQMPRFKLEYEETLNDTLKSLGMTDPFEPHKANFTNMITTRDDAFIDSVKHKSFIEVNEEGTEAAAVTSIEVGVTSARPEPEAPFSMVINRPFFFTIMDETSNTILFMGSIEMPEE